MNRKASGFITLSLTYQLKSRLTRLISQAFVIVARILLGAKSRHFICSRENDSAACSAQSLHKVFSPMPEFAMTRSFPTRSARKQLVFAAVVLGISAAMPHVSNAAPVLFGTNAYEFVEVANPFVGDNNSWDSASAAAATATFNGVNGHLATVTSQAENDFIESLVTSSFPGFNGAWLGGNYQGWLEGPEAGMTFAQVGGYTNWNSLEPNNIGLMYMSIGTSTPNSGSAGKWLDDSGAQGIPDATADPVIGYFVEYENAAMVPEPTSIALLAFGLLGAAFARRRRDH